MRLLQASTTCVMDQAGPGVAPACSHPPPNTPPRATWGTVWPVQTVGAWDSQTGETVDVLRMPDPVTSVVRDLCAPRPADASSTPDCYPTLTPHPPLDQAANRRFVAASSRDGTVAVWLRRVARPPACLADGSAQAPVPVAARTTLKFASKLRVAPKVRKVALDRDVLMCSAGNSLSVHKLSGRGTVEGACASGCVY